MTKTMYVLLSRESPCEACPQIDPFLPMEANDENCIEIMKDLKLNPQTVTVNKKKLVSFSSKASILKLMNEMESLYSEGFDFKIGVLKDGKIVNLKNDPKKKYRYEMVVDFYKKDNGFNSKVKESVYNFIIKNYDVRVIPVDIGMGICVSFPSENELVKCANKVLNKFNVRNIRRI